MKAYAIKDMQDSIRVGTIKLAENGCIEIFCQGRDWQKLQNEDGYRYVPVLITEITNEKV